MWDVEDADLTEFLYARPSVLEGVARVLDLGNTLTEYNTALSPSQADFFALRSDWLTVGHDLITAEAKFEELIQREENDGRESAA